MNKAGTKRYGPSDWKRYTTSSEHVNKLLEEYPKECFHFEILMFARTKAILSYAEANILHKVDALTTLDSLGLPQFINKRIDPIRWVTKDYPVDEVNRLCRDIIPFTPSDPYEV